MTTPSPVRGVCAEIQPEGRAAELLSMPQSFAEDASGEPTIMSATMAKPLTRLRPTRSYATLWDVTGLELSAR